MKPAARLFSFLLVASLTQGCDTQRASGPRPARDTRATEAVQSPQLSALSTGPLVVHIIAPQATDPAIDQALDDHYAWLDTTAQSTTSSSSSCPAQRGSPDSTGSCRHWPRGLGITSSD